MSEYTETKPISEYFCTVLSFCVRYIQPPAEDNETILCFCKNLDFIMSTTRYLKIVMQYKKKGCFAICLGKVYTQTKSKYKIIPLQQFKCNT